MPQHLKRILLLLPLVLTGCGDSPFGAYEVSVHAGKDSPRVMGIAIIQKDKIIADGQTAVVTEWKSAGDSLTAIGESGQRLVQFTKSENGELIQEVGQSQAVYRKYKF